MTPIAAPARPLGRIPSVVACSAGADLRVEWRERGGGVLAACSLWIDDTPALPGHRVGLIGRYEAQGPDGRAMLAWCCDRLARSGCTIAIGPMDGDTWHHYRFVTERGAEPPFSMEPQNDDTWPGHFEAAGFAPIVRYVSALDEELRTVDPRLEAVERRMDRLGVCVRDLDPLNIAAEMRRIHTVSLAAFARAPLFRPITFERFERLCEPLLPHLRPELVAIAEQEGRPVGFVFAVPDICERARGAPPRTVIIKSLAVLPERPLAGLGALLKQRCTQAARALGCQRSIHALMHEENAAVRALSGRSARIFRRYALYGRVLAR